MFKDDFFSCVSFCSPKNPFKDFTGYGQIRKPSKKPGSSMN
jgi:hypothetical protein